MKQLLLYGQGGHARVVADCAKRLGATIVGYFDNEHPYRADLWEQASLLIAIGNPSVRKRIAMECLHTFATLVHPAAVIGEGVELGEGTVVLAGAVIQAGAKLGRHVIVNANVTIDHDALVEDFVTTYPGVYIGANAVIGEASLIGPNAVILRSVTVKASSELNPNELRE